MHRTELNRLVLHAAAAACVCVATEESEAQIYPSKVIRVVVGFPAGGGADITTRLLTHRLSANLGQPAVVENRPGAATAIAVELVAKAPADGHTLLMMSSSTTIQSVVRSDLPYNLERDLVPVSLVASGAFVLVVHPSVPARSVKELVVLARSQPGKLTYGSDGVASAFHLAAELFFSMAKISGVVHVPYKGGAATATANASGQTDMSFIGIAGALPFLRADKLRALAVTTAKRAPLIPSLPTLDESGFQGYDRSTWYGIIAPARVPKDIVARLNSEIGRILDLPEMKEALGRQGLDPQPNTPEQFAAFIRGELAQNGRLVKLIGLKPE